VVGLILKLEAMGRVRMPGGQRALLLHLVEGPLQRLFEGMPRLRPGAVSDVGRPGRDLTMEQRLICVAYRNFSQVLRDLDNEPANPGERLTETRLWVLEQQFLLLDRQIFHAMRVRLSPPPGTWSEVHGQYRYFLDRFGQTGDNEPAGEYGGDFDILSAYKRLLLLGIAAGFTGDEPTAEGFAARLRGWTAQTRLETPDRGGIGSMTWIVDPTRDGPPFQADGPADLGSRSSVLVPPPGFPSLTKTSGPAGQQG
jgi:hypothetical protein